MKGPIFLDSKDVYVKRVLFIGLASALFMSGCKDKAQDAYAKCIQLEAQGEINLAWIACDSAIAQDPNSKSGKAAATKLAQMKPGYDAWKTAANAKRAKETKELSLRVQEHEAERLKALRLKVHRKYLGDGPDSFCTEKGLPPYRWNYVGGTFSEDAELAHSDGCKSAYGLSENTSYCCPDKPQPRAN
jgi:hypothetical protein